MLFGWFELGPPSSGLSQQLWGQKWHQDANLPQAALPDHLSLPGVGRGGKREPPANGEYAVRSPEMVPEQQWTFVAEVRKEMWWRRETGKPWPQQKGEELFTWPVLRRHHDFGTGIEVLFKLTSISASSCHFQSREIRINWTAARQALESHKWFVRAFFWEVTTSTSTFRHRMCPYLSTAPVLPCRAWNKPAHTQFSIAVWIS